MSQFHGITMFLVTVSGSMLRVDPRERPSINDIVSQLQEVAIARGVNLKAALELRPTAREELQGGSTESLNQLNSPVRARLTHHGSVPSF